MNKVVEMAEQLGTAIHAARREIHLPYLVKKGKAEDITADGKKDDP